MATCDGLITADILFDCLNSSTAGLETNVLLINRKQIDYSAVTFDATVTSLMTNFQLLSGNTGYLLQGVKQNQSGASEIVQKEFSSNKVKHTFSGVVLNPTAENIEQLNLMNDGGEFVAIVERKFKGEDNDDAFLVFGFHLGLYLTTMTYNTNENDGVIQFTLESADGSEEPRLPYVLLETDYATTKTAFDNKFAEA